MYSRALADSSLFALFFDTRQVSAAPGCEALPQKKMEKSRVAYAVANQSDKIINKYQNMS